MSFQIFSTSLVSGIIASLISVLITVVFAGVWRSIIMPWYREQQYFGPEIKGAWEATIKYIDTPPNRVVYYLKRQGILVKGHAHCHEGPGKGMTWSLEGKFKNLILNLNYESTNPTRLDRGSVSVMLINNGQSLNGHICYYSDAQNVIKTVAIGLSRVDDDGQNLTQ